MKRTVTFDQSERGRRRFEMIWQGYLVGGIIAKNTNKDRDRESIRREAGILRKLKGISVSAPDSPKLLNEFEARGLLPEGEHALTLTEPEHALLTKYVEMPQIWLPNAADDVVEMWDFLSAADKMEDDK